MGRLLSCTSAALAWLLAGWPGAASGAPVAWLTGPALQERLRLPADDVYWSGLPLRPALHRFARAARVAILLDRRVDPDQRVDLSLRDLPLRESFQRIANHLGLALSLPGSLAYLGPADAASRVWTLVELRREEARRLPAAAGRKLLQAERLSWPDFATPRDLLAQLASRSGIEIRGLDRIPHDLWGAADLPAIPLLDRITLVAIQFDLTFEIAADGSGVTLVPVPDDVAIVRSYPGARRAQELADAWAELAPGARIKVVGDKVFVKGLMEDHQRISDSQHPRRPISRAPRAKGEGERQYTVRVVERPLGRVLQELAARLDLELKIDQEALAEAGISLDQQVSFGVKDATLDGLFEAVLKPAGCTFRRQGQAIEVRPAK